MVAICLSISVCLTLLSGRSPSRFTGKLPFALCDCVSRSLMKKKMGLDVQEAIGKTVFEKTNGKSQRRQGEASDVDMELGGGRRDG